MLYMGVDPGKSGAIAVIDETDMVDVGFIRNDATESDIARYISGWLLRPFCYIERVSAMPKQGVSSTFKFGVSYGFLRGCLISSGIPFEEVTPRKWQAAMGCLSGGDKNVTKARAQQLFPQIKVIHAIADALLIAEFCRRVRTGQLRD
jgi:Holliday junction resolvasome RuvABC endonuclease subunit